LEVDKSQAAEIFRRLMPLSFFIEAASAEHER
jgi:hypothetical protein